MAKRRKMKMSGRLVVSGPKAKVKAFCTAHGGKLHKGKCRITASASLGKAPKRRRKARR